MGIHFYASWQSYSANDSFMDHHNVNLLCKISKHQFWNHLMLLNIQYCSKYFSWVCFLLRNDKQQANYWYFSDSFWYYLDFLSKGRECSLEYFPLLWRRKKLVQNSECFDGDKCWCYECFFYCLGEMDEEKAAFYKRFQPHIRYISSLFCNIFSNYSHNAFQKRCFFDS